MKDSKSKLFFNEYFYLILSSIVLVLLYNAIYWLVYFCLIPWLFYLKKAKKINLIAIMVMIAGTALIDSLYLYQYSLWYNFKPNLIVIIASLIFFVPFLYLSKLLMEKKYYCLTIPSLFFVEFFYFYFLPFNNFWINWSMFMNSFPIIIQYIGSYGITFLIVVFNVVLFDILYRIVEYKKIKFNFSIVLLVILILVLFVFNFSIFPQNTNDNTTISIAGVQDNIGQDWNERINDKDKNLQTYLDLAQKAVNSKEDLDIIVFSEYRFSHLLEHDFKTLSKLRNFAYKNNVTLVIGGYLLANSSDTNSKWYDSLYIIDKDGIKNYNAHQPISILDQNAIKYPYYNQDIKIDNTSVGFAMCYDENFAYVFTEYVRKYNVGMFIISGNIHNSFGKVGLNLLSLNSNLRAVENNRYIFRVETSGVTKVIDNHGEVLVSLPIIKQEILYYDIPIILEKTFYLQNKNMINSMLLLFALSVLLVLSIIPKFKLSKKYIK